MKKSLLFDVIKMPAFSLSSLATLARGKITESPRMTEIIGKVISIRPSRLKIFSGSLIVKDTGGQIHLIKVSSKSLEGIRIGDSVEVKVENERARLIIRLCRRIIIQKNS